MSIKILAAFMFLAVANATTVYTAEWTGINGKSCPGTATTSSKVTVGMCTTWNYSSNVQIFFKLEVADVLTTTIHQYSTSDCLGQSTQYLVFNWPDEKCAAFHSGGMKILPPGSSYLSSAAGFADCTSGTCITSNTLAPTNVGDTNAPTPTTSAPTNAGVPSYVYNLYMASWTGLNAGNGGTCPARNPHVSTRVTVDLCSQSTVNGKTYNFKVTRSGTTYTFNSWRIPASGATVAT